MIRLSSHPCQDENAINFLFNFPFNVFMSLHRLILMKALSKLPKSGLRSPQEILHTEYSTMEL